VSKVLDRESLTRYLYSMTNDRNEGSREVFHDDTVD